MTDDPKQRPDADLLERVPVRPAAPAAPAPNVSRLPANAGGLPSGAEPTAQRPRAELEKELGEAEGALQFMGKAHPLRAQTEAQVKRLKALLAATR